ncbi:hypothetical protein [Pseudomonas mosselii]|uniref:hypothetical protein n=1 Tax=Pseudomonas mosselii TaxID=78327 RepID=UPI000A0FE824|nr:hypothetical protein [Pseudomonas mosselii]ORT69552.1 hypothetical protein BTA49_14375 [Pseudomonas mosselii]
MKKIVPDPPRLAPFIAIRPTLTREEAMAAAVEVATAISDVLDIYFKTACALLEHKPEVQP